MFELVTDPDHPMPKFDGTQACAKVDPEIFFAAPSDRVGNDMAKDICRSCSFVAECLEYAVSQPGLEGVWGATTARQRQTIRGNMRKNKRSNSDV